jgi:hypothetical protein
VVDWAGDLKSSNEGEPPQWLIFRYINADWMRVLPALGEGS